MYVVVGGVCGVGGGVGWCMWLLWVVEVVVYVEGVCCVGGGGGWCMWRWVVSWCRGWRWVAYVVVGGALSCGRSDWLQDAVQRESFFLPWRRIERGDVAQGLKTADHVHSGTS